jgi:hypothetical protein
MLRSQRLLRPRSSRSSLLSRSSLSFRSSRSLGALPALALFSLAPLLALTANARDAHACGGCFHPPPPPGPQENESVVTDHRMVFSISPSQTVLWDQIRYSGDPKEFAWVLPVHPGAHVELSHDAWIAALDASTQSVVTGPAPKVCGNGVSYGGDTSSGGGCGFGSSSDTASAFGGNAPTQDVDGGFAGNGGVQLVSQDTVGPYETVTVRASQGDALETWLVDNGFDVAAAMKPTLGAYAAEGFDFIALKLRPGAGVRAMQPVRIVSPGADASLPLRMVAAGIGSHVGLTLYVVTEGRYHTENFPDAVVDFTKLAWDPIESHSNFAALTEAAMAAGDGRGWITEYAGQPDVAIGGFSGNGTNPPLSQAYQSLCQPTYPAPETCDAGGPPPPLDAGGGSDAASDASPSDAATSVDAAPHTCPPPQKPSLCDDLSIALDGLHTRDVWVTRLRAHLPADALAAGDLRLTPTSRQEAMTNLHHTDAYVDPSYDPCPKTSQSTPTPSSTHSSGCACTTTAERDRARGRGRQTSEQLGTGLVFACAALATGALLRKRRRAARASR